MDTREKAEQMILESITLMLSPQKKQPATDGVWESSSGPSIPNQVHSLASAYATLRSTAP